MLESIGKSSSYISDKIPNDGYLDLGPEIAPDPSFKQIEKPIFTKFESTKAREAAFIEIIGKYRNTPEVSRLIPKIDIDDSYSLSSTQVYDLYQKIENGLSIYQMTDTIENVSTQNKNAFIDLTIAHEMVLLCNYKLVVYFAEQFESKTSVPLVDLIQEGNIGLCRAARTFDLTLGYKFSTYASWWIKQAIRVAVKNEKFKIRVPINVQSDIYQVDSMLDDFKVDIGRIPSTIEAERYTGMTMAKIDELKQLKSRKTQSLDDLIGPYDFNLADIIPGSGFIDTNGLIDSMIDKDEVTYLISRMTDQEKLFLSLRYDYPIDSLNGIIFDTPWGKMEYRQIMEIIPISSVTCKRNYDSIGTFMGISQSSTINYENNLFMRLRRIIQ